MEAVSKSKIKGGIGFRDFKNFNLALLVKQGWHLATDPESFWGKFIKALYFPSCSFFEAKRSRLEGRNLLELDMLLMGQKFGCGTTVDPVLS